MLTRYHAIATKLYLQYILSYTAPAGPMNAISGTSHDPVFANTTASSHLPVPETACVYSVHLHTP